MWQILSGTLLFIKSIPDLIGIFLEIKKLVNQGSNFKEKSDKVKEIKQAHKLLNNQDVSGYEKIVGSSSCPQCGFVRTQG